MSVDFFEDGPTTNPKKVKRGSTTPILDNFSRDLVKMAEEGKIEDLPGMDAKYEIPTSADVVIDSNKGITVEPVISLLNQKKIFPIG